MRNNLERRSKKSFRSKMLRLAEKQWNGRKGRKSCQRRKSSIIIGDSFRRTSRERKGVFRPIISSTKAGKIIELRLNFCEQIERRSI